MIPFENAYPYEVIQEDVYFLQCPFCTQENILLPLKDKDLSVIREGTKKRLVLPCCRESMIVIDTDRDYLLTNRRLR